MCQFWIRKAAGSIHAISNVSSLGPDDKIEEYCKIINLFRPDTNILYKALMSIGVMEDGIHREVACEAMRKWEEE